MLRWYDYPIAFLAADFIWASVQLALFHGMWLGGIGAYAVYKYGWDFYCNWRYEQEYGE